MATFSVGDFIQQGGDIFYVEGQMYTVLYCVPIEGDTQVLRADNVCRIPGDSELAFDWYKRRLAHLSYKLHKKQDEMDRLQSEISKWETLLHGTDKDTDRSNAGLEDISGASQVR